MKTFLSLLANILLAAVVAYGVFLIAVPSQTPSFGNYNPTGGGTYRLQSSIGGSDTSLTLTSFKEPTSNIAYTMSYLNSSIEYATIEPQSSGKEFVSFTGITQNSDGTATLTGLVRGLGFSYPYTASTTLQQSHSGQSILILSNPPQYSNQFLTLSNVSTSSAVLIFGSTTPPHYDATGAQKNGTYISTTSEFASVDYVNAVAVSGASNGTTAVKGIYQTAAARQNASSTATGSTGAQLAMTSLTATDTPQSGCAVGFTSTAGSGCSIIALLGGKIAQAWLDLTENWTFTGALNIAASAAKTLTLNSIAYIFPSTQTASSTSLQTNGSGTLTWEPTWNLLTSTTTSVAMTYATSSTFDARQDLRVIVYAPSSPSQCESLAFNSDFGTNYGSVYSRNAAAYIQQSTSHGILTFSDAATTTDLYAVYDINNILAKRKLVIFRVTESDAGADAPYDYTGSGVWNNTSAQITNVVVNANVSNCSGPIPAGTTIRVYGQ